MEPLAPVHALTLVLSNLASYDDVVPPPKRSKPASLMFPLVPPLS